MDRTNNAGVIAPPPIVALLTIALGLLFDWLFPISVLHVLLRLPTRLVIGGVLVASGVAVAIMALRIFHRVGTNVSPWQPTLKLATGGIYQWVRNPVYVGLGLLVAGLGLALASDWTIILMIPAALLVHYGVVLREERYLDAKFGDEYRRYKKSAPRYGWPT